MVNCYTEISLVNWVFLENFLNFISIIWTLTIFLFAIIKIIKIPRSCQNSRTGICTISHMLFFYNFYNCNFYNFQFYLIIRRLWWNELLIFCISTFCFLNNIWTILKFISCPIVNSMPDIQKYDVPSHLLKIFNDILLNNFTTFRF